MSRSIDVTRTGILLRPDCSRVLLRPFDPNSEERVLRILGRIMSVTERDAERLTQEMLSSFGGRHRKLRVFLLDRYAHVSRYLREADGIVTENRKLLIGSYFTQEYALESAALFNPSIVWHPDQSGLVDGIRRFVMSLRATGEGHLSSIGFRTGTISRENDIKIDPPERFVSAGEVVPDAYYDRHLFTRKLREIGISAAIIDEVFAGLGPLFTMRELEERLDQESRRHQSAPAKTRSFSRSREHIVSLAQTNYEVLFSKDQPFSGRILFPTAPTERNGMEDARFVRFTDDGAGGKIRYYATYTAYNGASTVPQLIETDDFRRFSVNTLNGPEIHNKGMAFFPRKIGGKYAMLSRQDNENMYLMLSDHPHFWSSKELIVAPKEPWEFVQLGNCGSPIETEAGWLVLSHGVGPMRRYSISALLLDLNDPRRVIGRLHEPLLFAEGDEREGYVPNVVYSCGALVNGDSLILPYAVSDFATSFAVAPLPLILACMLN